MSKCPSCGIELFLSLFQEVNLTFKSSFGQTSFRNTVCNRSSNWNLTKCPCVQMCVNRSHYTPCMSNLLFLFWFPFRCNRKDYWNSHLRFRHGDSHDCYCWHGVGSSANSQSASSGSAHCQFPVEHQS